MSHDPQDDAPLTTDDLHELIGKLNPWVDALENGKQPANALELIQNAQMQLWDAADQLDAYEKTLGDSND